MDMLVKLYDLPDNAERQRRMLADGIRVRRAMAYERTGVTDWVGQTFGSQGWIDEAKTAFSATPVTCFVAAHDHSVIGFCCYNTTCLGFVGPVGVAPDWRNRAVGETVLLAALNAMRVEGYGYAVAGCVGVPDFFQRAAGATEIAGSEPGVYARL